MANRNQRKKERKQQKRKEKKKDPRRQPISRPIAYRSPISHANARHRERLARQSPAAWEGELPEDVAVFDEAVCATLSPELVEQVAAVRAALRCACQSLGEEALAQTAAIPRSSPLSEWRIFVRGLVSWMASEAEAAREAWKRLDFERRPGRMAIALAASLRADLEQASIEVPAGEANAAPEDWTRRLDETLLYHAKLVRRVRFDRAAVRVAETGTRVPEEDRRLKVGPRKLKWLKEFAGEYRDTESHLVAALEHVALARAFHQEYADLFDQAAGALRGPRHDQRNKLLTFFYYLQFESQSAEAKTDRSLKAYLDVDLPQNADLSPALRKALASQIHLNEAVNLMRPRKGGFASWIFGEQEDPKEIRRRLDAAAREYPANRDAYQARVNWLESKSEYDRPTAAEQKKLETELAETMKAWSKGCPDDVEPRLWLVDYLLENELLKEAEPHVHWLAAARQDDPRVRATPWKWQLLQAMQGSRKKSSVGQAAAALQAADGIWPTWVSKQWRPYLEAALSLRAGRKEEFERRREEICRESGLVRDSVADACLMLGAAQQMHVPAADLKPLRAPVEAAVKNIGKVPDEELLQAGRFFWDLHRAQLLYPAYRMHGSKFAAELYKRFAARPKLVVGRLDDPQVQAAFLWCAETGAMRTGYEMQLPSWSKSPQVAKHPMFAAAVLTSYFKMRNQWGAEKHRTLGQIVREAAPSQRDPYYRHWFVALADRLEAAIGRWSQDRQMNSFADLFGAMGGAARGAFDDSDDDEVCDCEICRGLSAPGPRERRGNSRYEERLMETAAPRDPFAVLGVPADAGEEEVRARYLELVRRFPPERDPDKFREIRAAYEAAKDPLSIARRLLNPPDEEIPEWSAVIEEHKKIPPSLTPNFLLSLGNRAPAQPQNGQGTPHE